MKRALAGLGLFALLQVLTGRQPGALLLLGDRARLRGDLGTAQGWYEAARRPGDWRPPQRLGLLWLDREPARAETLLGEAAALHPDPLDVLLPLAHAQLAAGHLSECLSTLTRVLHLQPNCQEAMLLMAAAEPARAREWYQAVLNVNPYQCLAHEGLARLAMRSQDYRGALEEWRRARGINRESDAECSYQEGVCLLHLGDPAGGERELRRSVEENPRQAEAWLALGLMRESSAPAEARALFSRALELAPAGSVAEAARAGLGRLQGR